MTIVRPLLLVDACVLIDYVDTSRDVLKKVSKHVGQLHVTPTVFREVKQLRPDEAAALGMIVVEPSLDMVAEAAAKRGRLSFEDRLAVVVSKANGFTCVTNDTQLRLECGRQGVPVLWGLQLLIRLVRAKAISVAKAKTLGTAICASNDWLRHDVLKSFLEEVEGTR